ncbi:MAG: RNA polymerase sigma factor [Methylococcales bacterium]
MNLSIEALFNLYRQELVNWLTRFLSCRETAQDLVQESFLILTRVSAEQTIAEPRAFLYRTAKNLALDRLRRRKVIADCARTVEMRYEGAHLSAEQSASADQSLDRLEETLANLPELTREVFCLIKLDGLSYRESAHSLGLTERQVERHLMRAMLHCREILSEN